MVEYTYKGFKVHYKVEQSHESNLYKVDGYVNYLLDKKESAPKNFHTEYSTLTEAQDEFKKLVKDYIDFEWAEFNKMQD